MVHVLALMIFDIAPSQAEASEEWRGSFRAVGIAYFNVTERCVTNRKAK